MCLKINQNPSSGDPLKDSWPLNSGSHQLQGGDGWPAIAQASFSRRWSRSPGMLVGRVRWSSSAGLAAAHPCSLQPQRHKPQVRSSSLCRSRLQRFSHSLLEQKDRWGSGAGPESETKIGMQSRAKNRTWIWAGLLIQLPLFRKYRSQRSRLNTSTRGNQEDSDYSQTLWGFQ